MSSMGIIANLVSFDEMYHSIHHHNSSELRNAVVVQHDADTMCYNVLQTLVICQFVWDTTNLALIGAIFRNGGPGRGWDWLR